MSGSQPSSVLEPQATGLGMSVALCTYNGAAYVEQQLTSIFEQSVRPSEIVVADDGSTDGTIDIVETMIGPARSLGIDIRILVPGPAPLGPGKNFERALRATTGEYVALCDQDDIWHPDKLARSLDELRAADGIELVVSDVRLVDVAGNELAPSLFRSMAMTRRDWRLLHTDCVPRLLRDNFTAGMTFTMRREFVDRALPIPDGWLHDYWLMLVASLAGTLAVITDQLVDYRVHGLNATAGVLPGDDSGGRTWMDVSAIWLSGRNRLQKLAVRRRDMRAIDRKLSFEMRRTRVKWGARPRALVAVEYLTGNYHRHTLRPTRTAAKNLLGRS